MNKKTITLVLLVAAIIAGCQQTQDVTNFEQCAQAGNPIMESYPMQCTANGKTFVQTITPEAQPLPPDQSGTAAGIAPSLIHDLAVPPAVDAAKAYVMQKTGASEKEIIVLEAHVREWPDSCLGAAGLEDTLDLEVCAEEIMPGYEIKINAQGKEYLLRTNGDGTQIRQISVTDTQEMIAIS